MKKTNYATGEKFLLWGVMIFYCFFTALGTLHHELWYDEAQAWCLARDNTFPELLNQLTYEGHPPLWYLVLFVLSQLGFGCNSMLVVSWLASCLTVCLVLFKSPFNNYVKAAFVLSGGMIYYMPVVSRVYCLIPLLLFSVSVIYPKRNDYPVAFGLIIACLANTHICMSGFVGIVGIYMLIDYFKGLRSDPMNLKIRKTLGLFIAAFGVATLVFPLLGSLSNNNITSSANYSISDTLKSVLCSFQNISLAMIDYTSDSLFTKLLAGAIGSMMVIYLLLLRHYLKGLTMAVTYITVYIFTIEVIWYTHPQRGFSFLYTLVCIYWIAKQNESPVRYCYKFTDNLETEGLRLLTDKILRIDKAFDKWITVFLCVILFLTSPSGIMLWSYDLHNSFSLSRNCAEYIEYNLPDNSVVLVDNDVFPSSVSAYLPNTHFYSMTLQKFLSFDTNRVIETEVNSEKVVSDLSGFEHIYYLKYDTVSGMYEDCFIDNKTPIYSASSHVVDYVVVKCVQIYETDLSEVEYTVRQMEVT